MENKVDLQHNKIFHLEDSVVMYGVYNSDTLEDLINTIHKVHNRTTWNKTVFSTDQGLVPLVLNIQRCKLICNKFGIISQHS